MAVKPPDGSWEEAVIEVCGSSGDAAVMFTGEQDGEKGMGRVVDIQGD